MQPCAVKFRVAYEQLAPVGVPSQMPTATTTSSTDPLLASHAFWMRYKMAIIAAVVLLAVGGAAFGAYRFHRSKRESTAAALLADARVAANFQKVATDFADTAAGASAQLLLANELRKQDKFAEANTILQGFVARYPKHELATTALMALAANQESLGKRDEAIETYRRVAATYPKSFNAPLALLAQVPLLKQKGQVEEARRVCETVMTQYRDSAAAGQASQQLRLLKPTTAAATPPAQGSGEAPQSSATAASTPAAAASP